MNSNNQLKEINIKNHTCYYFDDIININHLNLDNILLNEKSFENILLYDIAYKTPYSVGSLPIIFDEVDEYLRKYDKTKYLALFHSEKFDRIFNKI